MFPVDRALRITEGIGTPECRGLREHIFRSHEFLAVPMARYYLRTARNGGHVAANTELRLLHKKLVLGRTFQGLFIDSPDEDVRRFAEQKSKELFRSFSHRLRRSPPSGKARALDYLFQELEKCGFDFPLDNPESATEAELGPALQRCFDPCWWRRQIRARQDAILEEVCIKLGLVHRRAGIYVSEHTLRKKVLQWKRNEELLGCLEAVNDLGEVLPLVDIAQRSVSNLVNRRNELMTRIAGFDRIAEGQGDTGLFYTLTAPSRYHSYLSKPCRRNVRYQGYTPRETQAYLNAVWQRARAKAHRQGIRFYGFRVVEPHHDGTPHWHLLLFVAPEQAEALTAILREYALAEDADEPGAARHRFKVEEIDRSKGSAAAYIAKYIAKNVNGEDVGEDRYGHDAVTSAVRIRAWASNWGIRQFQQIGGPSVTVWRESRRLQRDALPEGLMDSLLDKLRQAADQGDWAAFVRLCGGPTSERSHQPLRAWHVVKRQPNKYGEQVSRLLGMIFVGAHKVVTRLRTWTIQVSRWVDHHGEALNFSTGGANAPPLEFCQ